VFRSYIRNHRRLSQTFLHRREPCSKISKNGNFMHRFLQLPLVEVGYYFPNVPDFRGRIRKLYELRSSMQVHWQKLSLFPHVDSFSPADRYGIALGNGKVYCNKKLVFCDHCAGTVNSPITDIDRVVALGLYPKSPYHFHIPLNVFVFIS
jgi:hypothetical protein